MTNTSKLKNPGTRVIISLLEKYEGKEGLKKVQRALNSMGKKVSVDGIIGNITINTIKSVNNKTLHRGIENLNNLISPKKTPKPKNTSKAIWVDYAKDELGTREIKGSKHNSRVLEYHAVSGGFSTDEVPWCGSFVNFIIRKAGYKSPKYPARAKSWLKFGKSSYKPVYGALAVKSRKGGGHVCFVLGEDASKKYIYCLGGNQHDEVNVSKYKKSVFMDFRVPLDYEGNNLPTYSGKSEAAGKEN